MTARFDRPNPPPSPETPSLWDETPEFAPTPQADSIEEAFDLFHAANPWVYRALVDLARQVTAAGRRRIGIGMLFEVLRWHWYRETTDVASDWKLNNNYRSRYARLIADREPDLADVFEFRKLTAP